MADVERAGFGLLSFVDCVLNHLVSGQLLWKISLLH